MDRGIQIVEDVAGDGTVVQRDELVTLDLQITLNRGEIVHPRERMTVRVGDRRVFPGLSKSIEGMRRGGYRKTRVSAHLAYGSQGIPGKVPPGAVLVCELWVMNSRTPEALAGGDDAKAFVMERWRPAGWSGGVSAARALGRMEALASGRTPPPTRVAARDAATSAGGTPAVRQDALARKEKLPRRTWPSVARAR